MGKPRLGPVPGKATRGLFFVSGDTSMRVGYDRPAAANSSLAGSSGKTAAGALLA